MREVLQNWIEFLEEFLGLKLFRLLVKVFVIVLFVYFIWPYAKSTYHLVRNRGNIEIQLLEMKKRIAVLEDKIELLTPENPNRLKKPKNDNR